MFGMFLAWLHDWAHRDNPQTLAVQALHEENARLHRDLAAAHARIRELTADKEFYYNAYTEQHSHGHQRTL